MALSDRKGLLKRSKNVKKTKTATIDDLLDAFDEQQLNLRQLSERFERSNIDVTDPRRSTGLSTQEAKCLIRSGKGGGVGPPTKLSNWLLLLRQWLNIMWIALTAAGTLNLLTYFLDPTAPMKLYIAVSIFGMVCVMCFVSYIAERKTQESYFPVVHRGDSLTQLCCSVVRDGRMRTIPLSQVVVGDLMLISSGMHVLADVRLLYCTGLKMDMCRLISDETDSVELVAEAASSDVSALEARNIAFRGSLCVDGDGLGVVIRAAGKTLVDGLVSESLKGYKRKAVLKDEVMKSMRYIFLMALSMGTIMFMWAAYTWHFVNVMGILVSGAIVIIVANIPQGLPTTLQCHLTVGARRIGAKKLLLKNVDVIHSLGATTTIVSDMAGVLTKGCLTVSRLWCDDQHFPARPDKEEKEWSVEDDVESPLKELLSAMTVCNRMNGAHTTTSALTQCSNNNSNTSHDAYIPTTTTLRDAELGDSRSPSAHPSEWLPLEAVTSTVRDGNPTELALLHYANQLAGVEEIRGRFEVVFEIPFDEVRGWRLVIAKALEKTHPDGQATFTLMISGDPRFLSELSSTIASENGPLPLDEKRRLDLHEVYLQLHDKGHIVMGFASKTFAAREDTLFSTGAGNYPDDDYCFLGMAGIIAEPREEAADVVNKCREAGIKMIVVTEENSTAARATSQRVGLIRPEVAPVRLEEKRDEKQHDAFVIVDDEVDCAIVEGNSLRVLTTEEWDDLLRLPKVVIARGTFKHKLMIVEECQRRKEVVAVAASHFTDILALRRADIGFTLASSDSELTKQEADIVVEDGSIGSILAGIEESRLMYDRMKKAVAFTLTHLWPEALAIAIHLVLGFPKALSFLQILSIDLGSDLLPAITLVCEKGESDLMKRPGRKRGAHLVSWSVLLYSYFLAGSIIAAGCFAAYISVFSYYGISARDLAFSSAAGSQNFTTNGVFFSTSDQERITYEAAAAWHFTLSLSQMYHLWTCTTRRKSIFHHGVKNYAGMLACVANILIVCFVVFTPGVQSVVGTMPPPFHIWFFSAVVGVLLVAFNEARKFFIRRSSVSCKCLSFLEW